jgi:hypothetical protein
MIQFTCMQLSKVERERIQYQHGQGTLALLSHLLLLKILLLQGLEGYNRSQRLNNNGQKQVIQIINKIV